MKNFYFVIILMLTICFAPAWANAESSVSRGNAAYQEGKFEEAFKSYQEAAEDGIAEAQYKIGLMYTLGQGVEKNLPEAVFWYRRAAQQHHTEAQAAIKNGTLKCTVDEEDLKRNESTKVKLDPDEHPYLLVTQCRFIGAVSVRKVSVPKGKENDVLSAKVPKSQHCVSFLHDGASFKKGDAVILDSQKADKQQTFKINVQCGGANRKPFPIRIKHDNENSAKAAVKSGPHFCNIFG